MHQVSLNALNVDSGDRVAVFAFSEEMRLFYMNERAQSLSRESRPTASAATGSVPPEVLRLAVTLRRPGDLRATRATYLQREIRHALSPWVLQGFVIPTDSHSEGGLIVVLMEPLGAVVPQGGNRFGFTPRESDIAELVVRGLTNKQIAAQLRLAEQTVKDHMTHIMVKTETSTRTALVAFLFTGTGPERFKLGAEAGSELKLH